MIIYADLLVKIFVKCFVLFVNISHIRCRNYEFSTVSFLINYERKHKN